jgi:uncharacterized protein YjbI with pentapeptide repeats
MKLDLPNFAAASTCTSANWFAAIFAAAFLTLISASAVVGQAGPEAMNPAEKWVVVQAAAGRTADLIKQFPKEKDRKLGAHFLENLLIGALANFKPHRRGLVITGAIIEEPMDVINGQVPCDIVLKECQFMRYANFSRASFAGGVSFERSTFKLGADFSSPKFGYMAVFTDTVFEGPVDFSGADIAFGLIGNRAQFKDQKEGAAFLGIKAPLVLFDKAMFKGPVSFGLSSIAVQLAVSGAQFTGEADFIATKIGGQFILDGAQFRGVSFNNISVGQKASLKDAVFEGPVDFITAEIGGQLLADRAQFKDAKQGVSFNSINIRGNASLQDAVFEGPVDFVAAEIGGMLLADRAQFNDAVKGVEFNSIKCGRSAHFIGTRFAGPVSLSDSSFLDLYINTHSVPELDLSRSFD